MKKIVFLVFLVSLGAATLRADDQVAAVQQELKDQGFYYGQVDGQGGPETTAAIRRYQIRNGLQVDGALNKQTLDSLKIAGNPQKLPPQPAPLDNDNEPAQPQLRRRPLQLPRPRLRLPIRTPPTP
jgi:peptidoglycan hydrolase-like protein with peptidoglycan-binding domain